MNYIHKVLILVGIYACVSCTWISLETVINGGPTPSVIDTLVAMLLTCLLYEKAVPKEECEDEWKE